MDWPIKPFESGPAIARKVQTTTLRDAIEPILSEEGLKSTLLSLADKLNENIQKVSCCKNTQICLKI